MLVAKCAFKWLYITRKRKGSKKEWVYNLDDFIDKLFI